MPDVMTTSNLSETMKNWVELYADSLYSWTFHKTSNKETAEDLVQETFLAAVQSFEKYKGESNPKTWLFSILNHKIIDFYRKKSSNPITLENDNASVFFDNDEGWKDEKAPKDWQEDDASLLDNEDFNAVLQKCLDALPEKWSMSVKLKYLLGKDNEDICQELGITTTNFWQIVHRAKLQLRNCIENNWFNN